MLEPLTREHKKLSFDAGGASVFWREFSGQVGDGEQSGDGLVAQSPENPKILVSRSVCDQKR